MTKLSPQSGLFLLLGPESSYDIETALETTFQETMKVSIHPRWSEILDLAEGETLSLKQIEEACFQIDAWTSSLESSRQFLSTLHDHLKNILVERSLAADDQKRHLAPTLTTDSPPPLLIDDEDPLA